MGSPLANFGDQQLPGRRRCQWLRCVVFWGVHRVVSRCVVSWLRCVNTVIPRPERTRTVELGGGVRPYAAVRRRVGVPYAITRALDVLAGLLYPLKWAQCAREQSLRPPKSSRARAENVRGAYAPAYGRTAPPSSTVRVCDGLGITVFI